MIKCVFIIGFDKLIKKGFIASGSPKIHEISEYASIVLNIFKVRCNSKVV